MISNDNIEIYQGNSLSFGFRVTDNDGQPKSFAGCSARCQIRLSPDSAIPIAEMSTINGGITLATGLLTLVMSPMQTEALDFSGAPLGQAIVNGITVSGMKAEYDIQVAQADGNVVTLERGFVIFVKGITR